VYKVTTKNLGETETLGKYIGGRLEKKDIVCLSGDLGAGKTTLTKAIALELGVNEYVTSPSYTIINEYSGRIPIYHFDVYRINDIEELYEIGYEEYFFGDGITIIEWASMILELIPEDSIFIDISVTSDNERTFTFSGNKKFLDDIKEGF
jgi:tRNA threonylcarbamoyladenosine biosynthesis protein TsaE